MAKFEGNLPKKDNTAPGWFSTFLDNYSFVVRYLIQLGKTGVNLSDVIVNTSHSQRVSHGQTIRIQHGLSVAPVSVQLQGGRYKYFTVNSLNTTIAEVSVYLLSTSLTDSEAYSNTNLINVLDSTIFKEGDSILINYQKRKIVNIVGNQIRLDAGVSTVLPCVVYLDSEVINFILI